MTDRATGTVEQRTQSLFRLFNLAEVLEPAAELRELGGGDARKRIAGHGRRLTRHAQRGDEKRHPCRCQREPGPHLTTSVARIAVCPAPHGREHSITKRPTVSARYFTTASPRRRFGISAFTSVPTMRKP